MTSPKPRYFAGQRIVLLGATGFTGRGVAEALVARGARPVLAGRDLVKLEALAGSLGVDVDVAQADVSDYASAGLWPVSS